MVVISLVTAAVLAVIDQVIKYFIELNLKPIGFVEVIKNLFSLSYVVNTGVAFGLLKDMGWLYIPVTLIGFAALIFILIKNKDGLTLWGFSAITMLLGGGLGNLIDRVFRGYVIDYIRISFFSYTFNFADCMVVVGSVFLILSVFIPSKDKGRHVKGKTGDKTKNNIGLE